MLTLFGQFSTTGFTKRENTASSYYQFGLADVKGQLRPRRALEIAAAGGHSLLFKGSTGYR